MKKFNQFIVCIPAIIIFFGSCKKDINGPMFASQNDSLRREEIDRFILDRINRYHSFNWEMASTEMLIRANELANDRIMSIGYKPEYMTDIERKLSDINIESIEWKSAREKLLQMILVSERKTDSSVSLTNILIWRDEVLPVLNLVIKNPETIKLLKSSKLIRYIEPMSYEPKSSGAIAQKKPIYDTISWSSGGGSGCGNNFAEPGLLENQDYVTIFPLTKQSWNYRFHSIQNAWARSSGAGVKIFLIDTGCEFDQENLGAAFNQGSSAGRTIEKTVTLPQSTLLGIPSGPIETPDDGCGHGTSLAGVCAAPRGTDGNTCGVAYNSHLITCRAAEDVYLDASREVKGVSDAFVSAANRSDVKIISMSMGRLTVSSQIKDAVLYAYGKGKLIFCAAGTSYSWTSGWAGVIFPASMPEVNAVTGVKDNNYNLSCSNCHDGSETDFTIVMEKATNGRKPLSLAMQGDVPSTVGGSSVATATAAGIAALVWSRFPTYSRDQILNKLIQNSANYPNKSSSLGWGNLNAYTATF